MDDNRSHSLTLDRRLHEAAFSVNLAFALVAYLFLLGPETVTSLLFRMDIVISRQLRLLPEVTPPKDYYTAAYFAFFVPAIALAGCIWALLRLFSKLALMRAVLRSVAGVTALAASPAWWLLSTYSASARYGWTPFAAIQFYELILMLLYVVLYLSRRLAVSAWVSITAFMVHNGFWFWQFGAIPFFMGYGGPVASTVTFVAGVAWVLYLRQLDHVSAAAC